MATSLLIKAVLPVLLAVTVVAIVLPQLYLPSAYGVVAGDELIFDYVVVLIGPSNLDRLASRVLMGEHYVLPNGTGWVEVPRPVKVALTQQEFEGILERLNLTDKVIDIVYLHPGFYVTKLPLSPDNTAMLLSVIDDFRYLEGYIVEGRLPRPCSPEAVYIRYAPLADETFSIGSSMDIMVPVVIGAQDVRGVNVTLRVVGSVALVAPGPQLIVDKCLIERLGLRVYEIPTLAILIVDKGSGKLVEDALKSIDEGAVVPRVVDGWWSGR